MKKKILTIALVVALAAILIVGGTMAFFTDTKVKDNVFTIGNVSAELNEPSWDPADPAHTNTYPGAILDKDPQVENTGANDAFVRIKVEGLDALKTAGLSANDIALIGLDTTNWTEIGDYYYYNTKLASGETTTALFTAIQVPTDTANDASHADITVTVTAEVIQADGIGIDTPTAAEIAAWFANF